MITRLFGELKKILSLRSLQARIFLIVLAAGLVPSVIMRYGILGNYEERSIEQRISTVQNQLMIVGNHLLSNNYFNTKPEGYTTLRTMTEKYRHLKQSLLIHQTLTEYACFGGPRSLGTAI